MVDRANLPLPPRPPGYAAPPKIPDEELPLMSASSLNSNHSKGIQEVIVIKDDRGKLGLKLKNIKTVRLLSSVKCDCLRRNIN